MPSGIQLPHFKTLRDVAWEAQLWTAGPESRLEVCGDSRVIINWVKGVWPVRFLPYEQCVGAVQKRFHRLFAQAGIRPRHDTADICRHIYRELNTEADHHANKYSNNWWLETYNAPAKCIRAFFDGSRRGNQAAYGWVVFASDLASCDCSSEWSWIATKSCVLPEGASITAAELEAASSVAAFLEAYYKGRKEAALQIQQFPFMDDQTIRKSSLAELV